MKDRSRNARRAPARPLVAWLVFLNGEEPEDTVSDVVYARDAAEARHVAFRRGSSGYALKDRGIDFFAPGPSREYPDDYLRCARLEDGDRLAARVSAPSIEGSIANLRSVGMQWLDEDSCSCCGLSSTGEIKGPFAVCRECDQCGECGHAEDCPTQEASSSS